MYSYGMTTKTSPPCLSTSYVYARGVIILIILHMIIVKQEHLDY